MRSEWFLEAFRCFAELWEPLRALEILQQDMTIFWRVSAYSWNAQKLLAGSYELLKESSWDKSSEYQKVKTLPFFFALQPHPWCIYWETQSIGKLATNIENKGDSAIHNNEDGCIAGAWEMTTHGEEKRWGSWEQTWWSIYPRRQK